MGELVIFSGGLDSTVCLWAAGAARAAAGSRAVVALSFDYGQLHRIELERAAAIADLAEVEHVVTVIDTRAWSGSALVDPSVAVPDATAVDPRAIPVTYVPARNLVFLSMAMAVAEARDLDTVHLGVNALDYSGYPDCRPEFVESFRESAGLALKRGVEGRPVQISTPLIAMTKADIVRRGLDLGAPLAMTWSCYRGGPRPCTTCDACVLRAKGFAAAGAVDPALA